MSDGQPLDTEAALSGKRPGRRTQAERSAAMRLRLLDAAVRVLIARGYAGTTVRAICGESAVSPGALQHHFPSREEIVMAALDHIFSEVVARLEALDAAPAEPAARAARIIDSLWAFYGGPRYLAASEILMGVRQVPALRQRVGESRARLTEHYRRMWDRLMRGTPLGERPRWTLLTFVISTLRGLALIQVNESDMALVAPQLELLRVMLGRALREGDMFLEGESADTQAKRAGLRLAVV
jgi:AcrR family transcriptional regulator